MTGEAKRDALRDEILLATVRNVVFDGWTDRAIADGTAAAGHDRNAAWRAFPGGATEMIAHFSDWADRRMLAVLEREAGSFARLRVRDKITRAVRVRLEILEPHRDAVRRAMTLLAMRGNAPLAARLLYRTVDAMWRAAGDTATDVNFYTKRGLLAGVQSSTLLYWLADRSADHAATWAFLDRRIADVMAVGKAIGRVRGLGERFDRLPSPLRLAARLRGRIRAPAAGRTRARRPENPAT